MSIHLRVSLSVSLGMLLAACNSNPGDDTSSPPRKSVNGHVTIVTSPARGDTVEAIPAQALVFQVPDGKPGDMLQLFTHSAFNGSGGPHGMYTCTTDAHFCGPDQVVRLDSALQVSVRLQFGTKAGSAAVIIIGNRWTDSIEYTVLAGQPHSFHFDHRDSSVYVGHGYNVGPSLLDRFSNATGGAAITATGGSSVASISGNGTFSAKAIGRTFALFKAGTAVDTAWITVPPVGTIAAFSSGIAPFQEGVVTVNLDGSGTQFLAATGDPSYYQLVDWMPDGQVALVTSNRLSQVDASHTVTKLIGAPDTLGIEGQPSAARDGSVVFTGWVDSGGVALADVWRIASVGATAVKLPFPRRSMFSANWQPAVSPDGREVAFVGDNTGRHDLFVATTAGVVERGLGHVGTTPRWSPVGNHIAFNSDTTLYVIDSDGSNYHLAGAGHYIYPRPDWSPDALWLIARTRNRLEIINVANNTTMLMPPWTAALLYPAWRH